MSFILNTSKDLSLIHILIESSATNLQTSFVNRIEVLDCFLCRRNLTLDLLDNPLRKSELRSLDGKHQNGNEVPRNKDRDVFDL